MVVPTLNSYKELSKLVTSLKTQTYKEWRTIFIDGDSNIDHKLWINSCCSDSRFSIIKENNKAKGIYPSMSQGIELIKDEEWVIFMGSDDWFNSPFALEIMAQKITSPCNIKQINLLLYGTQFLQKNNHKISRKNNIPPKFMKKISLSNLIFLGYVPMHHSVCFSSKVIKKFMPYNYQYKLAADCDLFFRLFRSEFINIGFISDILINIQDGGVSSKYTFVRLKEVISIYYSNYGFLFLFPFFLRYISKFFMRYISK